VTSIHVANYVTKPEDISNQFNNFFPTVGENLVKDLFAKNPSQNVDFNFFVISQLIKVSLLNQLTRESYLN